MPPEAQPVQTDQMQPPVMIGGPSETLEAKPTTFVDDLIKFQSARSSVPPKPDAPKETPAPDAVPTTDLVDRPVVIEQKKDGVYYNGKQYSQEEINQVLRERDANIAAKQAIPAKDEEELETMMYTDPKRYNQIIQDKAAQKALNHIEERNRQIDVRAKFFNDYKDLRGNEDLVEYHATKMQASIANLPPEEALSKLAQAVRSRLSAISGKKVATEELSSKPAVTAGATGTQSGAAPAPKGDSEMTFIEQMNKFQRRGKTRY